MSINVNLFLMDYIYIKDTYQFIKYLHKIEIDGIKELAVDIEGEYNLHSYGEKVCLLQIFDGTNAIIVDVFRVETSQLKKFFENRDIAKIMFDCISDQNIVYKSYHSHIKTILDLKPAVDLLELQSRNLSGVLFEILGKKISNKKKFQRYNWQKRPLDKKALHYSIQDVIYLIELKDILFKQLIDKNLIEQYIIRNIRAQNKKQVKNQKPRIFLKGLYNSLGKNQKLVFKKLYWLRDKYAKELNWPPNNLITNDNIKKLATNQCNINELLFNNKLPYNIRNKLLREIKTIL